MRAFKTILCPVDASDFSARAVRHAFACGTTFGADVVAMSVRPITVAPDFWRVPELVALSSPVDQGEAVESVRAFVLNAAGAVPLDVRVAFGPVAPEILRVAREIEADLIVMGTHGLGGFERLLLGSVTEKVLRKASCPILTVSGQAAEPAAATGPVVCGVDQSPSSRRALDYALAFAQHGSRKLTLVHALEDMSNEEPKFANHFNAPECWRAIAPEIQKSYEALVTNEIRAWCEVDVRVPIGRAGQEVVGIANEIGAALIVVGSAGTAMPLGSTTHRIVREAECPVLAVPAEAMR